MTIWFWADPHIGHGGLNTQFRNYKNSDEADAEIIAGINDNVEAGDLVWILGDLGNPKMRYKLKRKVQYKVILGNHDKASHVKRLFGEGVVYEQKTIKIDGHDIFLCHYPCIFWNKSHHKSLHLYGHCVDTDTEILTEYGWKKYNEINKNHLIFSIRDGYFHKNKILDIIINRNIQEPMFFHEGKSHSLCVSSKHRMLDVDEKYVLADEYFSKNENSLILSGNNNNIGLNISDDLLRLYICIAADGSYNSKTNLARLRCKKEYKIKYFCEILQKLSINFSKNKQKDLSICLNFQLPKKLMNLNIKGLDWHLLLCNRNQAKIIEEAYCYTDGYNHPSRSNFIYTSKKTELDILQAVFSINGYSATSSYRDGHGFSNNRSYQLCITKDRNFVKRIQFSNKNPVQKILPKNKINWCITTEFGNFLARRNGKVFVTGNCHSQREQWLDNLLPERRSMDVGIDNAYRLLGERRPFAWEEIKGFLANRKGHDELDFYRKFHEGITA